MAGVFAPRTAIGKTLLVLGGYVLAFVAASAVVSAYVAATDSRDRVGASGMSAFGDSLLFLWVLGVAAIPATGLGLYYLRPLRAFWIASCLMALAIALTGIAALATSLGFRDADPHSLLGLWAMLAPLRILVAPLFAIAFVVCGIFAPRRGLRAGFLAASMIEIAVFAGTMLIWFRSR